MVGLLAEGTGVQNHMLPFRNLGNSVYPTLLVSFGIDTKSPFFLMSVPREVKDPT